MKVKFPKIPSTLAKQCQSLPKMYNSHIWITPPADDGTSFLGISLFAKHYFARLCKLNYSYYLPTNYGMNHAEKIKAFLIQTEDRRKSQTMRLAEKIEYDRFAIKKAEPFCILETLEFDVELKAPVEMRVVEIDYNSYYENQLQFSEYYFRVQILDFKQFKELSTEEQYQKEVKMFELP